MILTFDIGNSRIKWGLWQAGQMMASGLTASSVSAVQELMTMFLADYAVPEKVQAVCVAGEIMARALTTSVQKTWGLAVTFLHTTRTYSGRGRALINAYDDVTMYGADRWAALIAACDEFSQPLCVISAGTAVTFDLITANGRHLGGRILPSLQTMQAAVLHNAASIQHTSADDLNRWDVKFAPALFAKDTDAAIKSGVYYLFVAGLSAACSQAVETLGQSSKIIITGGLAPTVLDFLKPAGRGTNEYKAELIHRPALVLQGVYSALNQL